MHVLLLQLAGLHTEDMNSLEGVKLRSKIQSVKQDTIKYRILLTLVEPLKLIHRDTTSENVRKSEIYDIFKSHASMLMPR